MVVCRRQEAVRSVFQGRVKGGTGIQQSVLGRDRIQLLDVATLSNMRADLHLELRKRLHGAPVIDCLHYCLPGPPDDWNALLATMLLGSRLGHPSVGGTAMNTSLMWHTGMADGAVT